MNKTKFLTVLLSIFSVFMFNSCTEETELLDPCVLSPCNGSSFQVDFAGKTYIATVTSAEFTSSGIAISGAKSNGENFEFLIDGATIGTYSGDSVDMSYVENIAAEFDYANINAEGDSNGSITISEIDAVNKTITGTFSFTGYYSDTVGAAREPIEFTNGTFTIPFTGDNPNPDPVDSFFKATFSGQTFDATTTQAVIAGGAIIIQGAKANGENFSFAIDGTTAKSYTSDEVLLTYSPDATSEFVYWNMDESLVSNGSLVITEINTVDSTISGTFQYTGHWSDSDNPRTPIVFTNGSFTIPYTGNASSTDTFFAKVDGAEFQDDLIAVAVSESPSFDIISINAFDASQNSIVISFRDNLVVGQQYSISGLADPTFHASYTLDDIEYEAVNGTITITSISATKVTGTFQIAVSDSDATVEYMITEGAFDVGL